ncbi:hypothetical protein [Moritella sp. Urea-trap-13]|uniref:hypothetical protein n=1 Tax=Moritella sp. Urea-trap-13 TaxID=2058327 RepID=UPI000C34C6B1|nr:hypothetical protein [Moritella sp. Urea-trap-13]PKH08186.1 hypothetical protein CXF93_05795 [Moritella sp. Urea-trap-13]
MGIENELVAFLESNIKDGVNKPRDIEIIKFYYGLKESSWPTLEETAKMFSIGSRERIRQLLNAKFRDYVNNNDIPSLDNFVKILQSKEYWLVSEFEKEIHATGLIDRDTHIKGIFNLIEDIGIFCGFEIYNSDLKRSTRNSYTANRNSFLIKVVDIKEVIKLLNKAKGLGRCGVANLNFLEDDLGNYYQLIWSLIDNSPASWIKIDRDDHWYVFENRENTLVNYSEKVFLVIDSCDPSILATIYKNALSGRQHEYPYPPVEIIEDYLKGSAYFVNTGSELTFTGETTKLTDIEKDLILFFGLNTTLSFSTLDKHLTEKGYGKPHISKATNYSPLVFVDKSQGLKHHVYSLIGQMKSISKLQTALNLYESCVFRLSPFLNTGTDKIRNNTTRREQYILQDWLFKDKEHESCALCGEEFSVNTLVVAHKKPRSECNEIERLDPYIVMPLCLMGCDHLYEKMYVYIDGEEVKRGIEFSNVKAESDFIEALIGRKIDSKWLLGNKAYFRSPSKKLLRTNS